MKIEVESTTKTVEMNGVEARVWEGKTDTGIPVHCFITRIAVDINDRAANDQFQAELEERRTPENADINSYPTRMII